MTPNQLASLIESGELETLEFRATAESLRDAVATVCAMLNQRGGHVLFGISPDGRTVGQQVSDRTIEELSAEFRRIDPPAFPSIETVRLEDQLEVIVTSVSSGLSAPYRYRGTAYRRVGNTTQSMSVEEHNRILLERMHKQSRWENQPADGWSINDLSHSEIRNTVAEAVRIGRMDEPASREPEVLLRELELIEDGTLLRAAAVLFGNRERLESYLPQCLLRVARFRGLDRSEFLDNRQFTGNAFTLLASAQRFLRETIPIASRFELGRMTRIDEPQYPFLAVREAVANAVCHRDYSITVGSIGMAVYDDRLEVTSIGPLHFGLTPEDLFVPHQSKPWNPFIARTFYRRGVIEEWGRGTIKMAEHAAEAGLPHPEIEEVGDCVTVRFFRSREVSLQETEANLTGRQSAILHLLRGSAHPLALREIRTLAGPQTSQWRLREDLSILKAKRLAESFGHGRGARWKPL